MSGRLYTATNQSVLSDANKPWLPLENIAEMLSTLPKTSKLLQSVVKEVDLLKRKVESIVRYAYAGGAWTTRTTKMAFWKQKNSKYLHMVWEHRGWRSQVLMKP